MLILSVFILLSMVGKSQSKEKEHPIDKDWRKCVESYGSNYSKSAMFECHDIAYKKWDAELNNNYKILMGKLDETGKTALRNTQIAWIKFRDSEFKVLSSIQTILNESYYDEIALGNRREIVKQRVLELKSHFDNLEYFGL